MPSKLYPNNQRYIDRKSLATHTRVAIYKRATIAPSAMAAKPAPDTALLGEAAPVNMAGTDAFA